MSARERACNALELGAPWRGDYVSLLQPLTTAMVQTAFSDVLPSDVYTTHDSPFLQLSIPRQNIGAANSRQGNLLKH